MIADRLPSLLAVLDAVRTSRGIASPDLADRLQLGPSLVRQRLAQLEGVGLVVPIGRAPSTGGRAPRLYVHRALEDSTVVGVDIGAREIAVVLMTSDGGVRATLRQPSDLGRDPEVVLGAVSQLVTEASRADGSTLRAIGVSLPAPVDFASGLPVSPPVMPTWDRFPLREELSASFGVPAVVDNDVNARLLGELRANDTAAAAGHAVFFYVSHGVGVAIAIDGRIYRGANGAAGDIGHTKVANGGVAICRCGNLGCLEAIVGTEAFERDGTLLAQSGHSPALAARLAETGTVRALDITEAAEAGDPAATALYARVSTLLADNLSALVSLLNPHLVVLGGGARRGESLLLDPIREAVQVTASELTTRDLSIVVSHVEDGAARGAAHLALDRLFSRDLEELQAAGAWRPASTET